MGPVWFYRCFQRNTKLVCRFLPGHRPGTYCGDDGELPDRTILATVYELPRSTRRFKKTGLRKPVDKKINNHDKLSIDPTTDRRVRERRVPDRRKLPDTASNWEV